MLGSGTVVRALRSKSSIATAVAFVALSTVFTALAFGATGSLTFVELDKDGVSGVSGIGGAIDVAISPDGGNAYVVGTNSGAMATFTRNPSTGALTFLEQDVDGVSGVDGISGARGVEVSPDGANVYVTGHTDSAVATFTRNPTTGALTFLEQDKDGVSGVDGLAGAWGVDVSPDGKSVYVAGDADNAVATFSRDPGTGALTFVEQDKDGVSGVDGLAVATGVVVSPGAGGNVYVASCVDSAVVTFDRDATTGALTFVEQDKQGVDGVTGMGCARGLAISGDGANVYVAAESGDAVATFNRNATTGSLAFAGSQFDGVSGADGLDGARDVAVSPDCGSVYVASTVDDRVAGFSRDASSGALTYIEAAGAAGSQGTNGADAVTVAPDSAFVYSTGESDNAVSTFSREGAGGECGSTTTPPPGGGGSPAARTISLKGSKKKVKKGKKVKLTGDLAAPTDPGCESGQTVTLLRKRGKGSFATLRAVTTDGSGGFSTTDKVKKSSQYRAQVVATSACGSADSKAVKVKAKKKKKKKKK